ncbi:MAG: hypothetical protein ACRD0P_05925 [Stackebrandtia sp.]
MELVLSDSSRVIAGVMLITIVTIEFGGSFVARMAVNKVPATEFQKTFARAGHGHAGMLVTLGLVGLLMADAAGLTGIMGMMGRLGVPVAAILIPAGFFFSSMGKGEITKPNGWFALTWLGAAILAIGVLTLGIGLLAG